jgi:hypothetical protein
MDLLVARVVKGYLRTVGVKLASKFGKPLYGYDSKEKSYLVEDYPYGFKLRTSIRYWLEYTPKKGWRFCSQTMNPKAAPGTWNKPKASTYALMAACMYLDSQEHVQWAAVTEYTDETDVLDFVEAFPQADFKVLKIFTEKKIRYIKAVLAGEVVWKVNGVPKPESEADLKRHQNELEVWGKIDKKI